MKKLIIIISLILFTACSNTNHSNAIHQDLFDQIDINSYQNIMIVAHPDDETIWGGMHLIKDKYLVICLTNGDNKTRAKEFNDVIKQTKGTGIILDYPDKTNGKRDDWKNSQKNIKNDLNYLLQKQTFSKIVTHNPSGEYGHQHHKMTSSIVTNIAKELNKTNCLYYFGKYYKKTSPMLSIKPTFNEELLKQKNQLLSIYSSQDKVCQHLQHMNAYENWISYQEWYFNS